jgi:hypothetical protein
MIKLAPCFFALIAASPAALAKSIFIVNCSVTSEDPTSAIEEKKDDPELIGIPVMTEAEGTLMMKDILDHHDAERMSRHGSIWTTVENSTFVRAEEGPAANGTQICILYEGEYKGQLELKRDL